MVVSSETQVVENAHKSLIVNKILRGPLLVSVFFQSPSPLLDKSDAMRYFKSDKIEFKN